MGAAHWSFVWVTVLVSVFVWRLEAFLDHAFSNSTHTHIAMLLSFANLIITGSACIHSSVCALFSSFVHSLMHPAISQDQAIVMSKLAEMMHKMTITPHDNPSVVYAPTTPRLTSGEVPVFCPAVMVYLD